MDIVLSEAMLPYCICVVMLNLHINIKANRSSWPKVLVWNSGLLFRLRPAGEAVFFFVFVLIKKSFSVAQCHGRKWEKFPNFVLFKLVISVIINMKKKYFLRNMSGSLKNYILLTTFIAINSKKCTEMHWRFGILLVWSIQVFIHAITIFPGVDVKQIPPKVRLCNAQRQCRNKTRATLQTLRVWVVC